MTNKKELTLEELKKAMRENEEKQQEDFIDRLVDQIELLNEKAVRKSYVPTEHEREQFNKIYTIVTNMNNWF